MAVRVINPSIKTGANTSDQIKIPDSSVNGIENYQKIGSGICYDTSTSDTAGTWNVTIPNITELTEGLTIKVRLKTSYNSTTNTLNVNGLGAKTVYFRYGTKLTSHYAKESVLALTYTASAIGSGTDTSGWIVENIYDSTNTYQLRVYNTKPKTKSALYRYMICFVNNDGLLIPANNTSNSTATTKTLTTESFNLFDSIYYYNSTTTISANGQVGTGTLYKQLSIDLRYSFNTGTTLVAPNGVYLKVTADGSQFKLATDTPVTQSLPTSDDGYFYCYLGRAYSTYQIELVPEHPIYLYKNGIIQEYGAYAKSVAETALSSIPTKVSQLTNDSGFTTNTGTITGITMNGASKGTSGVVDLGTVITAHQDISGKLSKTENTGVSVLGTTKATTTLGGNQLVAPNGIIFAGTAANAGLVTRGICGVSTPDSKGACAKENLYINYDNTNTYNTGRMLILQAGETGTNYGNNMYQYAVPRGDIVKAWVEAKGYLTSHQDISGKANLAGGNTFSGLQTINAPTDVSGSETTTLKAKTSNGGAIVFGKEGPNSGTMIRLDQADGTCRLRFRGSSTAGAMVWEQPEQGAQLYVDLGKDGSDKHRVTFPSSAGTLALTSQIPTVNNGTLTIQKNGTNVQTFTANQSGNATANITVPTKTSELTNDSGFLTSHQDISGKANLEGGNTFTGYQQFDEGLSSPSTIEANGLRLTDDGIGGDEYFSASYNQNNPFVNFGGAAGSCMLMCDGNEGTFGQVLTSRGTGQSPQWTSIPTYSLSGTTLTITLP